MVPFRTLPVAREFGIIRYLILLIGFPMSAAPTTQPTGPHRMRLHRARRRAGLRCLTLEVREIEIATLIRRGLLRPDSRQDNAAVRNALYSLLDRHLGGGM